MVQRSLVLLGVLATVALWRSPPAPPARAAKPVDPAHLTALVVDPFAGVAGRAGGGPTYDTGLRCDCTWPTGLDPCFVPDSCECMCASGPGSPEIYAPPR